MIGEKSTNHIEEGSRGDLGFRPRLVTDAERELRLLRYAKIGNRRNAKLIGMGAVALAMEVAAVLVVVRSGAPVGIALFLAASAVMLLTLVLDDFLP